MPVVHTISKGLDELSAMQRVVAAHLSESGNNHWATRMDVDILSNELKICFCILGNEPVSTVPRERGGAKCPACIHVCSGRCQPLGYIVQHFSLAFSRFVSRFGMIWRVDFKAASCQQKCRLLWQMLLTVLGRRDSAKSHQWLSPCVEWLGPCAGLFARFAGMLGMFTMFGMLAFASLSSCHVSIAWQV